MSGFLYAGGVLGRSGVPLGLQHEGAHGIGHILGEIHVTWSEAVPADALLALYMIKKITAENDVITCCRTGERAIHTWFVFYYLLDAFGFEQAHNYDGSWIEWENVIGLPVVRRAEEIREEIYCILRISL